MNRIIAFYLALFAILSISHSTSVENVPVFLWGNNGFASSPALKVYTPQEFKDLVHSQQTENTVTLVFYENNLSTEDITQCKREDQSTCFEFVQSVSPKTYLSAVSNPLKTLKDAAHYKKHVHTHLNSDGSFNEIDVSAGEYVFISLSDSQENEAKNSVLSRHDNAIKSFINKFSDSYDILAVYTGKHASAHDHKLNKREVEKATPKAAQETVPDPGKFVNLGAGKVFIYWTSLKTLNSNNEWKDLEITDISMPVSNETAYQIVVKGPEVDLSFNIISKFGNWYLEDPKFQTISFKFFEQVLGVTDGFSYTCSSGLKMLSSVSDAELAWHGLQIEAAFGENSLKQFSDPWDCVGYMSPAIWSGIFVVFILLFIIFIGFSWVYDIKTMDRFDDPKGKTITVTEQE